MHSKPFSLLDLTVEMLISRNFFNLKAIEIPSIIFALLICGNFRLRYYYSAPS